MFDAVIFDWSGTLSDDRQPVYEANMKLCRWFGKPTITFDEWLPSTLASAVEFLRQIGAKGSDEELQALYVRALVEAKEEGIHPQVYPDAADILEFLSRRRVKIGVLSTHPESHLREEASRYGLDYYLPLVVGDATDKATALSALAHYVRVEPREIAFVGDTIFDVLAAKRAGVVSVGVTTGYHSADKLREVNPDYLFSALSELANLFEGARKKVG